MRITTGIFSPLALLMLSAVSAASSGFICQNPGREYYLVYEPGVKFLIVNPDSQNTKMKILVDEKTDERHIITAETVKGGPIARLHIRPYQKLEYWDDGEVMQTDGCYKSN